MGPRWLCSGAAALSSVSVLNVAAGGEAGAPVWDAPRLSLHVCVCVEIAAFLPPTALMCGVAG